MNMWSALENKNDVFVSIIAFIFLELDLIKLGILNKF